MDTAPERVSLREVAVENEAIIRIGHYDSPDGRTVRLSAMVAAARGGTVSYTPAALDDLLAAAAPGAGSTVIEVTDESSMRAARRLRAEGATGIAVLNFASARSPGGGYVSGARAQEEDLCRVSALYTTLLRRPDFYTAHRATADHLYSHRVIYSPGVPVFRDEGYRLLDEPYRVSFLTCAAPNTGAIVHRNGDISGIPQILTERAARLLAVAARHGQRTLVLGAWGCGVFRNDPIQVAAAFRASLLRPGRFAGVFERITFAILDRTPYRPTLTAFRDTFAP
ncbi:MAG TPA: TIGR02452 family protein [Streptosporangiaceae bacterium]|nr:TIGR02452 family protein [Streptosporangiaceae bacterium]